VDVCVCARFNNGPVAPPPPPCSAVDTVALQVAFTGDAGGCTVLGFASTGPAVGSTPAWTYTVPNCYSDTVRG
jgi:hypothetical protein